MAFRLIKGSIALTYYNGRLQGSNPDGDSVWFKPNQRRNLQKINGRSAKFNKGGFAQLRLEGIDALELHYKGSNHQAKVPTLAARDFLLSELGFKTSKIEYAPSQHIPARVRRSAPKSVVAHIYVRSIDPFGRPVAFLFAGYTKTKDGSDVFVPAARFKNSVNGKLMLAGHVYPGYYSGRFVNEQIKGGLPAGIRDQLTKLKLQAQKQRHGLWPQDASVKGFKLQSGDNLQEIVIWPKLYRRLFVYYFKSSVIHPTLKGFIDWLRENKSQQNDKIYDIESGELRNLSDFLTMSGKKLKLSQDPQNLLIVPT